MKHIDEFVAGLCAIPEPGFTLDGVEAFLRDNPVDPASLTPFLHWEPTHYTRNLVHKCELFELIAICWDVGQASRVHNHAGQECWMSAPIGRLVVQNYEVLEQDAARGTCRLRPSTRLALDPSHPSRVEHEMPVHAVVNPAEHGTRAASLHVYSKPYDRCLVYSLENGSYCEVPLFYDTEYGRKVSR